MVERFRRIVFFSLEFHAINWRLIVPDVETSDCKLCPFRSNIPMLCELCNYTLMTVYV